MRLYDAAWAPSPRRVRIYLAEKGIQVERVTIDLRGDEQVGDAYLAVNPRGTVPALELDDGSVLTESTAICRFFEALHPEPPLFGVRPIEIARTEEWTRRIESDGYTAAVYALRNASPAFAGRAAAGKWPPIAQLPGLVERAQVMWSAFMTALEARLENVTWITSDQFTFADITALVTIDFARAAKLVVPEDAANIRRWHALASARPSAGA